MEVFKQIYGECSIESKYTSASLADKFIVFNSSTSEYYVYPTHTAFLLHMSQVEPNKRYFNEVIFGFMPQKLKFDIDANIADVEIFAEQFHQTTTEAVKHILTYIVGTIRTTFFILYQRELDPNDIIYCESKDTITSHTPTTKYSFHIIINFAVSNYKCAAAFTEKLRTYLPIHYQKFIDFGVNKSVQNFRITECVKNNSTRVKTLLSHSRTIANTLVTNIDCELLPDICDTAADTNMTTTTRVMSNDIKNAIKLCGDVCANHRFRCLSNNMLIFDRISPSHCKICLRTHNSENSLIVYLSYTDDCIDVKYSCRRDPTKKQEYVGRICGVNSNDANVLPHNEKSLDIALKDMSRDEPTLFDKLPTQLKYVYNRPILDEFPLVNTLCVHANMKMGKTKALEAFLQRHFASTLMPAIIRFVSFRQTFTFSIKSAFSDFVVYNEVKGLLDQPKLIVQVESLHRIKICPGVPKPDLLILDECESIFEQFDSGLLKHFNGSFAVFQWLLRESKHVVCMDAGMSDRTYRILERMRPDFGTEIKRNSGGAASQKVCYHHNTFRNATKDKYTFTTDKLKWLGMLYSALDNDERITIPISSLAEAKIIEANLRKRYKNKSIKLYSSETSIAERKDHFADVNTTWLNYDVLIYTPTISAGISFEQHHFDKMFGYFIDSSCPIPTCIQMMGRIRDVKSKQYVIYLNGTSNDMPTTPEDIKHALYTTRENLMKTLPCDGSFLSFTYTPEGNIQYYFDDYFYLWIENVRIRNLSHNEFVKLMVSTIASTGAKCVQLSDEIYEDETGLPPIIDGDLNDELKDIKTAHSETKCELNTAFFNAIAAAPEMTAEESEEVITAIAAQSDISRERKLSYEKYRLRSDYRFYHEIEEKFVATYYNYRTRRIYKNLLRIGTSNDTETILKKIQVEERENYLLYSDLNTHAQDIGKKYIFDQHRLSIGLFTSCGFENLRDQRYVIEPILANNLRKNQKSIIDNLDLICREFRFKRVKQKVIKQLATETNDAKYIHGWLRIINKVLAVMYDARIKASGDLYKLCNSKLFSYDHTDTSRPVIS